MARHFYTDEEIDKVAHLIRVGLGDKQIADATGFTYAQVTGLRHRLKHGSYHTKAEAPFHVSPVLKPFELTGDFMIVGDVHVPSTDYRLAQMVSAIGKKHLNHPRLIIGGDFFNMEAFSSYPALVASYSWREERKAGEVLMHEWLETFEEIYIIMGNHDRRIQKWSQGALEETDIFGMVVQNPKVNVSNLGYLTVNTPGTPWRVTHAKNYSVNQLTVADQLAQKYQMNIIQFHEHHLGIGYDRFGRYIVINGGGLFDAAQLVYATIDDSKSPGMKPGFVMLREGCPYLFGNPPFTDWGRWI